MSYGRESFKIAPGMVALALTLKYFFLTGYGISAIISEVPSFVIVGGSTFALMWASIVTVVSCAALIGVIRTWYTGKIIFERVTTAVVILAFIAYSIVLLVSSVSTGNMNRASLAWLPTALVAFPIIRYYWLVGIK